MRPASIAHYCSNSLQPVRHYHDGLWGTANRFGTHASPRFIGNHRPFQSGAEATAIQTLARWRRASKPRAASGVRRVDRRFSTHARSASHRKTLARAKAVLKPPQSRRWRVGGGASKPRVACGVRRVRRRFSTHASESIWHPLFDSVLSFMLKWPTVY